MLRPLDRARVSASPPPPPVNPIWGFLFLWPTEPNSKFLGEVFDLQRLYCPASGRQLSLLVDDAQCPQSRALGALVLGGRHLEVASALGDLESLQGSFEYWLVAGEALHLGVGVARAGRLVWEKPGSAPPLAQRSRFTRMSKGQRVWVDAAAPGGGLGADSAAQPACDPSGADPWAAAAQTALGTGSCPLLTGPFASVPFPARFPPQHKQKGAGGRAHFTSCSLRVCEWAAWGNSAPFLLLREAFSSRGSSGPRD